MYSHQDDPKKLIKTYSELNILQAIHMAKHPSVHAKVNIACDKETELGNMLFHRNQYTNHSLPNEVRAVLEVGGNEIFQDCF